jgi:nicotinic acid phosphoribosyltransferase
MFNETLLHFLSTGTRFRTLSASYPADRFPWVFMGARYLASDDLAIATRALSEEGILSTTKRWADKYIGTESHSQIVMWAGLQLEQQVETAIAAETDNEMVAATIRATVAFHLANPEVPLYVLGDFAARTVGCFETFRATAAVCASLGITLVGGRMDISKADLDDQPIVDAMYIKWVSKKNLLLPEGFPDHLEMKAKPGMSPELVQITRKQLRKAGLKNFNLVVSSGIKLQDIDAYVEAGANIVGIGEEAAYYLNKGECNYTSDAIGYFEGERFVPFAKEGRELSRLVGSESVANATRGYKIAGNLVRYNLADFV